MIGKRIRQARLMTGMTQTEVVRKLSCRGIDLTPAGLSKYEKGGSRPKPKLLMKLGQVLGVSPSYFLTESKVQIRWCAFSKHSSLGKRRQEQIKALMISPIESYVRLHETLFPDKLPEFPLGIDVKTVDDAEKAAFELRKVWNLGIQSIDSVTKSIENNGGIVVEYSRNVGEFDGLSGWVNNTYPAIVTKSNIPDDRRRLNIAHELGHLLLDCADLPEKTQEAIAYRFAAAFLVPSSTARNELGGKRKNLSIQELALLKRKYGLSMQAWIRRAYDLGIINFGHYRALNRQFGWQGWKKKEPVDFSGDEKPTRLEQMVLHALAEGIISPEEADKICPGCLEDETDQRDGPSVYASAIDVMKLPKAERERMLANSAKIAESEYRNNKDLTDFEAFEKDDLDLEEENGIDKSWARRNLES